MRRPLQAELAVPVPWRDAGQVFRGDPRRWLPEGSNHDGGLRWYVYLWAGQVGVLVHATIGEAFVDGEVLRRLVGFAPPPVGLVGKAAPAFEGCLELRPRRRGDAATLALLGRYRPPGGAPGALADRLLLHRVARHTARTFLDDAAERLRAGAPARGPHPTRGRIGQTALHGGWRRRP